MALRGGPIGSSSVATTIPGWRPDDFHHFYTDFLNEGVVKGSGNELAVTQHAAGANMSVDVATGKALIELTTTLLTPDYTYKSWLTSDEIEVVSVPTADPTNPRIDRIVAKFIPTVDPNGAASNIVSIVLVEGTPDPAPSAPATPSNAISLATISVPASDTTITNDQITDDRTFVQVQANTFSELARDADVLHEDLVAFTDWSELTIATGAITVTGPIHTVDTQGDASTDDLDTITAQVGSGEMVILKAAHTDRTVVVKHNTGNIKLADAADFSLDNTEKSITLIRQSTTWYEVARGIGTPTSTLYSKVVYCSGASSGTIGASSTAVIDFDTHTYTIPANDLVEGVAYEVEGPVVFALGAGNSDLYITVGTTNFALTRLTPTNTEPTVFRGVIFGTAAAGASVAVKVQQSATHGITTPDMSAGYQAANLATNGTLAIKISHAFGTSNGGNGATLAGLKITKHSSTPFS